MLGRSYGEEGCASFYRHANSVLELIDKLCKGDAVKPYELGQYLAARVAGVEAGATKKEEQAREDVLACNKRVLCHSERRKTLAASPTRYAARARPLPAAVTVTGSSSLAERAAVTGLPFGAAERSEGTLGGALHCLLCMSVFFFVSSFFFLLSSLFFFLVFFN